MSGLMTPESLSREGSPAPAEPVMLSTNASPEAQLTSLEVKNSESTGFSGAAQFHLAGQQLKFASGQQIQLATTGQPLQLVTGQQQFQLATAQPGQQLQLTSTQPGQQLQLATAQPGQPLQLTTGQSLQLTAGQPGQKVIVAGPAGHPRLIVPAHQLAVLTNGASSGPGSSGIGSVSRAEATTRTPARIVSVSQGGQLISQGASQLISQGTSQLTTVSQSGQILGQTVVTTRPLGKAIVTSQTPVLLQPAHSQISTGSFVTPPISETGVKRLYTTSNSSVRTEPWSNSNISPVSVDRQPPHGTPIAPGTQIILSEGVAGGVTRLSGGVSVAPLPPVSLPQHPLPPDPAKSLYGNSITSGSVVVTPAGNGPPAPPPPPPVPTVSVSMVEVHDNPIENKESSDERLEPEVKRIKLETSVGGQ